MKASLSWIRISCMDFSSWTWAEISATYIGKGPWILSVATISPGGHSFSTSGTYQNISSTICARPTSPLTLTSKPPMPSHG